VRDYRMAGVLDAQARVELLRERLIDYRARVEVSTEAELQSVVEETPAASHRGSARSTRVVASANATEDHGLAARARQLDGV